MELPSREGSGHLLLHEQDFEDTIPLPEAPVLFRWPSLDRSDEEEQRNATWIELFYDLVFVVCVARLGEDLNSHEHQLSYGVLGKYFSIFCPMWFAWWSTTHYLNMFSTGDSCQRLFMLLHIVIMTGLAININECSLSLESDSSPYDCRVFAAFLCANRLLMAVMWVWVAIGVRQIRVWSTIQICNNALTACGWVLYAIFAPRLHMADVGMWWVLVVLDLAYILSPCLLHVLAKWPRLSVKMPGLQIELLEERYGLFLIIVLGEAIKAATDFIRDTKNYMMQEYLNSFFIICIFFLLMLSYFEVNQNAAERTGEHALTRVWAGALFRVIYIPMLMCLLLSAAVVQKAVKSTELSGERRWIFCVSLAVVKVCFVIIQALHRGSGRGVRVMSKSKRVYAKFFLALSLVLIPLAPEQDMPCWALLLLVASVSFFYVLCDLFGRQIQGRYMQAHRAASDLLRLSSDLASLNSYRDREPTQELKGTQD